MLFEIKPLELQLAPKNGSIQLYKCGQLNIWCSSKGLLCHNEIEIIKCDFFSIWSCSFKHFFELIGRHRFSELFRNPAQIMDIDSACSIIVKQLKDSLNSCSGLFVTKFICYCIKELFEINSTRIFMCVQISNHCINGRVLCFKTKALHSCLQLFRINNTCAIGVKKSECLFNFLNLIIC